MHPFDNTPVSLVVCGLFTGAVLAVVMFSITYQMLKAWFQPPGARDWWALP